MESILYAKLPDEMVVVRVLGRGNHQNSGALRHLLDMTSSVDKTPYYIFDMEKCLSMDSTFMGVLANFGLRQLRSKKSKTVILNINAHVFEQLDLLGLKHVLDLRDGSDAPPPEVAEADKTKFSGAPSPQICKLEKTALMIEAHESLIDLDEGNEIKFRGVLQALRESLERGSDRNSS